jgi:hypothetical protein
MAFFLYPTLLDGSSKMAGGLGTKRLHLYIFPQLFSLACLCYKTKTTFITKPAKYRVKEELTHQDN